MKKKLVLLLSVVFVMCSLLCACGGESKKSTVTVDGTEYAFDEFVEIVNGNPIKYENEFVGKEVTVIGQLTTISGKTIYNGAPLDSYVDINYKCWINTSGYEDVLANLTEGDTVKATGTLGYNLGGFSVILGSFEAY